MKKDYITPTLCLVPLSIEDFICASSTYTLKERQAESGEEADSRRFNRTLLWDDINNTVN